MIKIPRDLDSMDIRNEFILMTIAELQLMTAASYTSFSSAVSRVLQVWEFSSLFSSVDRWSFSNISSLSDHLKTCSYYQREERTEPVALACLGEVKDKRGEVKYKR